MTRESTVRISISFWVPAELILVVFNSDTTTWLVVARAKPGAKKFAILESYV